MRKKKYNMSKYANYCSEEIFTGTDGTEIVVRNHIPYEEKVSLAREMAEQILMIHDDMCCYYSYEGDAIEKLMVAKYYTNINTEGVSPGTVMDFMINNGLCDAVYEFIRDDWCAVVDIYQDIIHATEKVFDSDRSILRAVRTSFPFLFDGQDITETLANAENISGTLFDALAALKKENKEEQRINNGVMNVGGNILNFSKRE